MKLKTSPSLAAALLSAAIGGFASATVYCFLVFLRGSFTSGEFEWHPLEISVGSTLSVVFFVGNGCLSLLGVPGYVLLALETWPGGRASGSLVCPPRRPWHTGVPSLVCVGMGCVTLCLTSVHCQCRIAAQNVLVTWLAERGTHSSPGFRMRQGRRPCRTTMATCPPSQRS